MRKALKHARKRAETMNLQIPKTLRTTDQITDAIEAAEKETRPASGHLMSIKQFIKDCRDGYLIDYDGFGYMVIDGKRVAKSSTQISDKEIDIANTYRIKLASIDRIFKDRAQIDWLNR